MPISLSFVVVYIRLIPDSPRRRGEVTIIVTVNPSVNHHVRCIFPRWFPGFIAAGIHFFPTNIILRQSPIIFYPPIRTICSVFCPKAGNYGIHRAYFAAAIEMQRRRCIHGLVHSIDFSMRRLADNAHFDVVFRYPVFPAIALPGRRSIEIVFSFSEDHTPHHFLNRHFPSSFHSNTGILHFQSFFSDIIHHFYKKKLSNHREKSMDC